MINIYIIEPIRYNEMKTPEEYLSRGTGNFINCTDYDDAIVAMKQFAKDYHENEVKKLKEKSTVCDNCEGGIFIEHRLGKQCVNCGVIK